MPVTTSDPTLDFLATFEDAAAWDKIKRGVPIFVEHERTVSGKDGKKIRIKVDAARLAGLVRSLQDAESRGIVRRHTAGHIRYPLTEVPQIDQPPLVGFGRNARLGRFGPQGQLAILEDQYILKGKLPLVKDLPYRSPEVYFKEMTGREDSITGIAYLRIDPMLDMGMITYDNDVDCIFYSETAMVEVPKADKEETPKEEKKEPVPPGDLAGATPSDPTKPPDAQAPSEEDLGKFKSYMKSCYPHMDAMHSHYAKHYGMAAPSATNGSMPGATKEEEAVNMASTDQAVQYARIEAENKALKAENQATKAIVDDLVRKNRVAERRSDLAALGKEYPALDIEGALTYSQDLPAEQYAAFKGVLTKNLPRGPVGEPIETFDGMVESGKGQEFGEEHLKKALHYQRVHAGEKWDTLADHANEYALGKRSLQGSPVGK